MAKIKADTRVFLFYAFNHYCSVEIVRRGIIFEKVIRISHLRNEKVLPVSTAKCFDVFICNGAIVLRAGSFILLPGQGRKIMLCSVESRM